jgi:hypothetical protein
LAGIEGQAFVDIDSLLRPVYGHANQGASYGHTKIDGKQLLRKGLPHADRGEVHDHPLVGWIRSPHPEGRLTRKTMSYLTAIRKHAMTIGEDFPSSGQGAARGDAHPA